MKDLVLSIFTILAIFVGLPVLLLWIWDKMFGRRMTKEEMDEHSRRFQERLANPDVDEVEEHFGHALPAVLVALYEDSEELNRDNFDLFPPDRSESWFVAYYTPLDAEGLKNCFHDGDTYFGFADDGCGNAYLIDPRLSDPPVLFHDHETGEMDPVAPSLTAFLSWERREAEE